ncbi:MAG: SIMPL domain-containing protein [Mariprofundus sp.]
MPFSASAEAGQPTGTRIDLSATETVRIANDEVVISFRVEKEGESADDVRLYVNRVAGVIQQRLKKEPGVKLKTVGRNIQPVWKYPKHGQRMRTGWRMIQSGQVISSKLDAVPKWLDGIEAAGARISSLQFRVGNTASQQAENRLRLKAIAAFRRQAMTIAKGLNAKHFRIIHLDTASHAPQPVIYRSRAMMAKSADGVSPSLAAGGSRLDVTVNGTIQVPYTDFPVP